jgi:ribose 5-phosphate isomerase
MEQKHGTSPFSYLAGTAALMYIRPSMVVDPQYSWRLIEDPGPDFVGIGTGKTMEALIDVMAMSGEYEGKTIVPANKGTRLYLEKWISKGCKIKIGTFADLAGKRYTYYDGADEIVIPEESDFSGRMTAPYEERMWLMKGANKHTGNPGIEGCIHDEWKMAEGAAEFIVVIGNGDMKVSPYLGYRCKLPVEVKPPQEDAKPKRGTSFFRFVYKVIHPHADAKPSTEALAVECIKDVLQTKDVTKRTYWNESEGKDVPFMTEGGNYIYDAGFSGYKLKSVRHAIDGLRGHSGIVEIGISDIVPDRAVVAFNNPERRLKLYRKGSITRVVPDEPECMDHFLNARCKMPGTTLKMNDKPNDGWTIYRAS